MYNTPHFGKKTLEILKPFNLKEVQIHQLLNCECSFNVSSRLLSS